MYACFASIVVRGSRFWQWADHYCILQVASASRTMSVLDKQRASFRSWLAAWLHGGGGFQVWDFRHKGWVPWTNNNLLTQRLRSWSKGRMPLQSCPCLATLHALRPQLSAGARLTDRCDASVVPCPGLTGGCPVDPPGARPAVA